MPVYSTNVVAIEANIDQTAVGDYGEGALEFRLGPVTIGPGTAGWSVAAATDAEGTLVDGTTYYVGFTYTIPTSIGSLDTDLSQVAEVAIVAPNNSISVTDVDTLAPINNMIGGILPAASEIKCWVRVGTGTYYNVHTISDPTTATDFTIKELGATTSASIPGTEINLDSSNFYVMGVGTQYIGSSWQRYYCITCRNTMSSSIVSKMTLGRVKVVRVPNDTFGIYEKLNIWDYGAGAWINYTTQTTVGAEIHHQLPLDIGEAGVHEELNNNWTTEEPAYTEPLVADLHTHSHRYCDGAIVFYCNFDPATPVTTFNLPVDIGWLCNIL